MVKKKNMIPFKPIIGLAGAGVALGLGASVVEKTGGPAGGIVAVSKFMPVAGTLVGSYIVYKQVKNLEDVVRQKGRGRR